MNWPLLLNPLSTDSFYTHTETNMILCDCPKVSKVQMWIFDVHFIALKFLSPLFCGLAFFSQIYFRIIKNYILLQLRNELFEVRSDVVV